MTRNAGPRALLIAAVVLGAMARFVEIDRIPGINGDEAWYGVNANELLHGGTPFLHTPSGNFVNPVHSLPVLLLSLVAEPSFVVLRAPEVWWGVLSVMVAYPLLAKPLGATAALLATVLLALSPTGIEYSRLGWDPSGAPFFGVLATASALRNRPLLALGCLAVAFAVHPTNIFLAPFVLAIWAPHASSLYTAASVRAQRTFRLVTLATAIIAVPLSAVLITSIARMGRLPSIEMVVERVVSPGVWRDVWLSFVRLLSGVTSTTYIAGPMSRASVLVADAIALVALLAACGVLLWRIRSGHWRFAGSLLAGLTLSLLVFHIIAGPVAIEPGLERYAVPLLVPLIVVCAVGLSMPTPTRSRWGVVIAGVLAATHIAVVSGGYFYPLVTRGGDAHPTFRTGHVEPKRAAFDYIQRSTSDDEVVAIFAEDWWLYFPVRYLAIPERSHIFVEMLGNTPPVYAPGAVRPVYPRRPDKVFAIVFEQSAAWHQVRDLGRIVFTAVDPIGRPILHVVALPADQPLPFADPPPWSPAN